MNQVYIFFTIISFLFVTDAKSSPPHHLNSSSEAEFGIFGPVLVKNDNI